MLPQLWDKKISKNQTVMLVGAHNPVSAYIAALSGFDGIWWSGFEISTSLGLPDASLVSPDEISSILLRVSPSVTLPHIIDADAGYGGQQQLALAATRFMRVGASAICVEDQAHPKINSILPASERRMCSIYEMVERIHTIRKHTDQNFGIIARLESFIVGEELLQAIERAEAYTDAGCDAIVVHSRRTDTEDLKAFSSKWRHSIPLIAIPTTYNSYNTEELRSLGFAIVIFANVLMRAAIKAMRDSASLLANNKKLSLLEDTILSMEDIDDLIKTFWH